MEEIQRLNALSYAKLELDSNDYLWLVASNEGLVYVDTEKQAIHDILNILDKEQRFEWKENSEVIDMYGKQIKEYFAGHRKTFDFELDLLVGSPFQRSVWAQLERIPYGETRTYSDIAEMLGQPQSYRAVANAVGKNPLCIVIPCHRVLTKSGDIGGYRGGVALKKRLLQIEQENCGYERKSECEN